MTSIKSRQLRSLQTAIQNIEAGKAVRPVKEKKQKRENKKRLLKDELAEVLAQQEESPEQKAKKYALDCLIRREHGCIELLRKMKAKGFDEDISENVLRDLIDEGSQSDTRFAMAMIAHGFFKGQGPVKIRQDLQQKGLSGDVVSTAFEESDEDWFALAVEVRVKKYGTDIPNEWKDKAKQMRFLQQRGFEMDQINNAFE